MYSVKIPIVVQILEFFSGNRIELIPFALCEAT